MGQKIHPLGFRLGITQEHRSKWFAKTSDYPRFIIEDKLLRDTLFLEYPKAIIADIHISRQQTTLDIKTKQVFDIIEISIFTPVPAKILGRSKTSITELKEKLEEICQKTRSSKNQDLPKVNIDLMVLKVQNPYSSASVIADYLIEQLEQRKPFRMALKKALQRIQLAKLEGIKIEISGRLNGAEIARSEWVRKGRVPLQTLRADIDYVSKSAKTIYGILGIKVWAFKGEKT